MENQKLGLRDTENGNKNGKKGEICFMVIIREGKNGESTKRLNI